MRLVGAMLLTVVLWASAFVAIRLAVREYSAGALALFRFLVAGMGLACYQLLRPQQRISLPARRHLGPFAAMGLIGITIYHLALNAGERTVSAGNASLIVSLSPIFTALIAAVALGEHLGLVGWAGVLAGFAGAGVVALSGGDELRLEPGALLVLIAALAQAIYFVLQKPFLLRYTALAVTSYAIWLGTAGLLPFAAALLTTLRSASGEATLAAVYLGLFPGAIAYLSWAYVLARLPAGRAASALYLVPAGAILIAWLVLGERPSRLALLGGGIVLGGVTLVNTRGRTGATAWKRRPDRFASTPVEPMPRSHR